MFVFLLCIWKQNKGKQREQVEIEIVIWREKTSIKVVSYNLFLFWLWFKIAFKCNNNIVIIVRLKWKRILFYFEVKKVVLFCFEVGKGLSFVFRIETNISTLFWSEKKFCLVLEWKKVLTPLTMLSMSGLYDYHVPWHWLNIYNVRVHYFTVTRKYNLSLWSLSLTLPGVNFINVFTHSFYAANIPKAQKVIWLDCLFVLLESLSVKTMSKMLVKLTPGVTYPSQHFLLADMFTIMYKNVPNTVDLSFIAVVVVKAV